MIGAEIKKVRISKGLTQRSLASLAGISTSYLTDLENGKRRLNEEKLARIAAALQLRISDLTMEEGPQPQEIALLSLYRQLSESNRNAVFDLVSKLSKS